MKRILLTASGGPFLDADRARLDRVTPDEACAHPNWVMGRKISVDSATLMNKGLEFIEACLLFGVTPRQVEVLIHRESIVHSLVEYVDGSVLAQLGAPDMRTPIAHALAWPERVTSGVQSLDLIKVGTLRFEAPDLRRFPALGLAQEAARAGGLRPASLNAANEVAVAAFLEGGLNFARIPAVIESVMATTSGGEIRDLDDVLAADAEARRARFLIHPASRRARLRAPRWNSAGTSSGSSSPSACWSRCTSSVISGWRAGSASRCCASRWASASRCFKRVGRAPDHTEYVIAALPLGGYVRMLDERDGEVPPADLPRAFTRKPPWQRILVLLAGPAANILFAILVLWGMFWVNGRHAPEGGGRQGRRRLAGRRRRAARRRRDPRASTATDRSTRATPRSGC